MKFGKFTYGKCRICLKVTTVYEVTIVERGALSNSQYQAYQCCKCVPYKETV